ncbi:MAG: phosphotransferase, partial [Christensenellales bacterium]
EFESRINLNIPLEHLSQMVCNEYNLGDFVDNQLIEIGYEDYNYILTTKNGKYVVKVFSNERTDNNAQELAERAYVAYENGVSCPKIHKTKDDKCLLVLSLKNVQFRLLVMDYINGKDFLSLKELPNNKELELIATELAKLNCIEYNPPFIYDKWAIINFIEEYNKNISLVDDEDRPLIDKAFKALKSCDLSKLKYGFVHGDVIETNVIRDNNGKLYFIDFSVSNYLPRIVDIAVTICDLCLDLEDIETSKLRAKRFINTYEKTSPLSNYEKECLKKFIVCHQAITILETIREKKIEHNDSEENEIFLQKGKQGLRIVLDDNSVRELLS